MLHPSYNDLINKFNGDKEIPDDEAPEITRYSVVIAASKRARQLVDGDEPLIDNAEGKKPLSIAVEELYQQKVTIQTDSEDTPE